MAVISIPFVYLILLFAWSLMITLLILRFLRSLSFKVGLVDHPGGRKKHKNAVPLIGGISIFLGASALLIQSVPYSQTYMIFWLCCLVLVLLSVADDAYGLKPRHRLVMQAVLTSPIIVFGETSLSNLGNLLGCGDILLGQASFWFTSFSMVGITNAVNMMDGLDGLTGCVSLVELGCLLFLSIHCGAQTEAMVIAIVMGSVLAFLVFNLPTKFSEKHKIFLGDAGSALLGFTLAWLCVRLSQGSTNHYPPVLMLWIMALPLMDTLHLIINRKMRGISLFKADRRHIHHILLQLDYSPRQVVLILMSFSFMIAAGGVSLWMNGAPEWLLFAGMGILFLVYSAMAYLLKKRVSRRKYKFSILSSLKPSAKLTI